MSGTARAIAPLPVCSTKPTKTSNGVPVAVSALAIDSVDGQRARPAGVMRFDLLKVVGSSPARRASPDADRPDRSASRSIADQTCACVSMTLYPRLGLRAAPQAPAYDRNKLPARSSPVFGFPAFAMIAKGGPNLTSTMTLAFPRNFARKKGCKLVPALRRRYSLKAEWRARLRDDYLQNLRTDIVARCPRRRSVSRVGGRSARRLHPFLDRRATRRNSGQAFRRTNRFNPGRGRWRRA